MKVFALDYFVLYMWYSNICLGGWIEIEGILVYINTQLVFDPWYSDSYFSDWSVMEGIDLLCASL